MSSEPLVSVILPTFNRANLLTGSIGSVLAQNYTNWELIIWDDGSTDNTQEVVKSFTDNRIRYYWHENSGQAFALNQALAMIKGEYIAFLDDDDQWTEHKLAVQIDTLKKFEGIDLLFGDFRNVNVSTGDEGLCFEQSAIALRNLSKEEVDTDVFIIRDGMPENILKANFIGFDTVIVREHVLRNVGGFNEQLKNSLDVELWWRIALAGFSFGFVDDVVMQRFKYPNSLSSRSINMYTHYIRCLDSCLHYTLANNRRELLPALNDAYHKAWRGIIREYGLSGEKSKAVTAFVWATKYGVSWGTCYAIVGALMGFNKANRIRKIARTLKYHSRGLH